MGIDFKLEVEIETTYFDDDNQVEHISNYPIATFEIGNLRLFRSILTQKEINDYHGQKIVSGQDAARWLDNIRDKCGAVIDLVYEFISKLTMQNEQLMVCRHDYQKSKVLVIISWS